MCMYKACLYIMYVYIIFINLTHCCKYFKFHALYSLFQRILNTASVKVIIAAYQYQYILYIVYINIVYINISMYQYSIYQYSIYYI